MKKNIFLLALSISLTYYSHAQSGGPGVRLNAYGNYVFDDQVDSYYSNTSYFDGKIKGGLLWGAGLEFRLQQYYGIELMYLRLDTKAPVEYYDDTPLNPGIKTTDLNLGINYIMVGGARSLSPNPKVEPYGGFMLGMAIINSENPDNGYENSATKFAWGVRLGVNVWGAGRVGLKLQTQLLSVPQGAGGTLYFGTGGAGAGVSTYSTMMQFALGGGLTFKLGGQSSGTQTTSAPY